MKERRTKPRDLVINDGETTYRIEILDQIVVEGVTQLGLHIPPGKPGGPTLRARGWESTPYEIFVTLLGELIHAAEYAEDFAIPDEDVHKIARYLARVIRLNPHVLGMVATATAPEAQKETKRGRSVR